MGLMVGWWLARGRRRADSLPGAGLLRAEAGGSPASNPSSPALRSELLALGLYANRSGADSVFAFSSSLPGLVEGMEHRTQRLSSPARTILKKREAPPVSPE